MGFMTNDFVSHVKGRLNHREWREKFADTLDEWLSQAVREENWEAAEAFEAGILALRANNGAEKAGK